MIAMIRRGLQKAPKTKLLTISSKIADHDLNTKVNQAIKFLQKGLLVEIQFEHQDVKKRKYLRRLAAENKTAMTTKIAWNVDKVNYKRVIEDCILKVKPFAKSIPQKLSNVDPFISVVKLLGKQVNKDEM
eukprot:NODE_28_length_33831_cov_0.361200.p17 type:complete len:130 gc:universal NODE_28_length_33831_cov_0.361200:14078-13689(-)